MNRSKQYVDLTLRMIAQLEAEALAAQTSQAAAWRAFAARGVEFELGTDDSAWEVSVALAGRFHTRMKACFDNCMRIAARRKNLRYFEGFCTHLIPFEHAWLVDENGAVVEPTLCLRRDEESLDYFGMDVTAQLAEGRDHPWEPLWVAQLRKEGVI